jgi:hypothetical protein
MMLMRDRTHHLIRALAGVMLVMSAVACSGPDANGSVDGQHGRFTPTASATSHPTPLGQLPGAVGSPVTPPPTVAAATHAPTAASAGPTSTATATATTPAATATPSPPAPTVTVVPPTATGSTGAADAGLLPGHRIISYYGHPSTASMGVLGAYPIDELYQKLRDQAAAYDAADPSHPTVLAFEIIAMVAQQWPGDDGLYVARTGDDVIQPYVDFATAHDMIVILDLQIGWDTIPHQIESIRNWLELPNVHVAIDPEFSTKANAVVPTDRAPGEFIGEADGRDIQAGMDLVAQLVAEQRLPPKLFIVHQFESDMIYNKDQIHAEPGIQFVLVMDGFGGPDEKLGNYGVFVHDELIQYGGMKLFYTQDIPLLAAPDLTALDPPPLVIIYQ